MKIKSEKDFYSGLMFIFVGLAFAWGGSSYRIGESHRMGPGYFPIMLSILLVILGIAISIKGLVADIGEEGKIRHWAWRPLVCILAANFLFGVLLCGLPIIKLPSMGLIVAIYSLIIISSLGGEHFNLRNVLILATVYVLGCYLIFVVMLELRLPLLPVFFD
jgi:hypothetical protein